MTSLNVNTDILRNTGVGLDPATNSNVALHKIVIVGGGAGGAELAKKLGSTLGKRKQADITLLDSKLTHIWKPLLHEVAAGMLNTGADELEYMDHAYKNHYRFRLGYMDGIDRESKEILVAPTTDKKGSEIIPRRRFKYDTLIIAVGSLTNHFNIPGVAENCLFIDSLEEAKDFQQHLMKKMIKAQTRTKALREGELHVAIAGAGATGIELAAELYGATHQLVAYGFDQIEPDKDIKITIIEASDKILPALPEHLSNTTLAELKKLNIEVMTNERVIEATKKGFKTESGKFIPAEITVWAAGIKAPEFLANLVGLETNKINQLLVKTTLQTTNDNDIYAFGDCASCPILDKQGNTIGFVPPRAQAAHQQASFIVKSIKNRFNKWPLPEYKYVDYGSLVNLGKYSTVGNLMGNLLGRWSKSFFIEGLIARLMYKSLYKMHLLALHGYTHQILLTIANLLTKRMLKPRLKLH